MITVENIYKKWGGFALKNISLNVRDGEYYVILGPTGAGKTLLLETKAGFHKPERGRIILNGKDVTNLPPEKRGIGFVYQDYMLFPHMTVEENVEFGPKIRHMDMKERKETVNQILELVGLQKLKKRYPKTLSGGERQRVAIARALAVKPEILLLDEPLSALDVNTQKELRGELKRIHEKLGLTTIHVTHNQAEAYILADRIAVMSKGKIVQVGTPDEIFHKPKNDYVARFVGFENIFKGKVKSRKAGLSVIDVNGVQIEAVTSKEGVCTIGIRPEDIIVSRKPLESSLRNNLKGVIKDYIDMGSLVNLEVAVNQQTFTVTVTRRSFKELNLERNQTIYLGFKASAVHVM